MMEQVLQIMRVLGDGGTDIVSGGITLAMCVIGAFILLASIVAGIVSICLAISYIKYNRRQNSCQKTGEQIAREILDENGLSQIKVSKTGSILFGNSYSHFFKKVRLRRLTWRKTSVTSLAMAAQKSSLAVLDKEGDSDMKQRIRLTPFIYFGPVAFVPMVIVGVLLDMYVRSGSDALFTIVLSAAGLLFYLLSFVMSLLVLKTEKKAQAKALMMMAEDGLATKEELAMCRKLFRLYNIEYVNNMIIALLELIYRVLQLLSFVRGNGSKAVDS